MFALVAHNTTPSIMRFRSLGFVQAEWFRQLLMENGLMQFVSDLDKMSTMRESVTYRSYIYAFDVRVKKSFAVETLENFF